MAHHVPRHPKLGTRVLINERWYYVYGPAQLGDMSVQGRLIDDPGLQAPKTDPAIAAASRPIRAFEATSAHGGPLDFDEDEEARRLEHEFEHAYREMARTPPTTVAGFALMLQAVTFADRSSGSDVRFENFNSWRADREWADGRDIAVLKVLWSTPIAAELVAELGRSDAGAERPIQPPAEDPALRAFRAWQVALEREQSVWEHWQHLMPGTPEDAAAQQEADTVLIEEYAALEALGEVTATTAEGVHGQFVALVHMIAVGTASCTSHYDPERCELDVFGPEERKLDTKMMRAVNRGLLRMAGAERPDRA